MIFCPQLEVHGYCPLSVRVDDGVDGVGDGVTVGGGGVSVLCLCWYLWWHW